MEKLSKDELLFKLLGEMDLDAAQQAEEEGCTHCAEKKLHCGDYPRKPRGGLREWTRRYSFNCSREGCRKRKTPASVRFLGRRVYVGVVVVLVSAMMHGVKAKRVERLRQELGMDERTLKRWRRWWQDRFVPGGFWKGARAQFMPAVNETVVPLSLVDAFGARERNGMIKLLGFLAPITVPGALEGKAM